MNFGDVSLQSYVGNDDVTASTNLNLRCSKNTPVTFLTNDGVNVYSDTQQFRDAISYGMADPFGDGFDSYVSLNAEVKTVITNLTTGQTVSETAFNYVNISIHPDFYQIWTNNGDNTFTHTGMIYNQNGIVVPFNGNYPPDQNGEILQESHVYRIVNNGAVENLPKNTSGSSMTSGANKIPYTLSTTSTGDTMLSSTLSNPLTYNQNDGEFQTFPLYGFANVKEAPVGVYTDTNTITVDF